MSKEEAKIITDFNLVYGCLNCPDCIYGSLCSFGALRVKTEEAEGIEKLKKLKANHPEKPDS